MKISEVAAVGMTVLSIFLTSTLFMIGTHVYRNYLIRTRYNPLYMLDTIIQTGPSKEALPTIYLAELLELSQDQATNFYLFDPKEAETRLMSSPVIRSCEVKKIEPNTIYIDYKVRWPVAWLADFTNRAIDEEGRVFPIAPFFPPKRLPEIFLGLEECPDLLEGKEIALGYRLLELLTHNSPYFVKRIDLSAAFHESYGRRELIVVLESEKEDHYLRLATKEYEEGIKNYLTLAKTLTPSNTPFDKVIDLRISDLAYVEDYPKKGS